MAKVKQPLFSFSAKGTIADTLVYRDYVLGGRRDGRVNIKGFTKRPTGNRQSVKETGVKECQKVWADLNKDEKQSWDWVAFGREEKDGQRAWIPDLAGYHKFMSYGMRAFMRGDPIPRTLVELGEGFGKEPFGVTEFGSPTSEPGLKGFGKDRFGIDEFGSPSEKPILAGFGLDEFGFVPFGSPH